GMIQSLLVDRFKLALRRETKDLPVYVLTVARGGPKLQQFVEGSCDPTPNAAPPRPGQKRRCAGGGIRRKPPNFTSWGLAADGASIDRFINILSLLLTRPIIDKTGITGLF